MADINTMADANPQPLTTKRKRPARRRGKDIGHKNDAAQKRAGKEAGDGDGDGDGVVGESKAAQSQSDAPTQEGFQPQREKRKRPKRRRGWNIGQKSEGQAQAQVVSKDESKGQAEVASKGESKGQEGPRPQISEGKKRRNQRLNRYRLKKNKEWKAKRAEMATAAGGAAAGAAVAGGAKGMDGQKALGETTAAGTTTTTTTTPAVEEKGDGEVKEEQGGPQPQPEKNKMSRSRSRRRAKAKRAEVAAGEATDAAVAEGVEAMDTEMTPAPAAAEVMTTALAEEKGDGEAQDPAIPAIQAEAEANTVPVEDIQMVSA